MAASMVKSYTQFSLLRQFLMDNVWREHSTNHISQALCIPYIQRQCYHGTHICLMKKEMKNDKKLATLLMQGKLNKLPITQTVKKELPPIEVWRNMTVADLAMSAKRDINDILDALYIVQSNVYYKKDDIVTNLAIIYDVVKKLGGKPKNVPRPDEEIEKEMKYNELIQSPPDESVLVRRHPVVTIMGHVDHGKTTLLDALRNTSVVNTEFGGITQHIGAFNVTLKSGEKVTFLDTPGHAAFTSMRYRGAHVTDIVVLVVAADDGVKEQTLQSIKMAKDANVPIIVAINKIDKPKADIKRTQHMLAEHDIVVEELGGQVQCVNISALKRTNLQTLTEAIVVQAELMDLKGDPVGLVEGVVIECTNSVGRGKLVTTLVQRGTLRKGCLLLSGFAWAKVRAMFNDAGLSILEAKPSDAVQIIGWRELPKVGDEVLEVKNERILRTLLKYRETQRDGALAKEHKEASDKRYEEHLREYKKLLAIKREIGMLTPVLDVVNKQVSQPKKETDSVPELNLILKGDVAGSLEAILDMFDTYTENKLCRLNVVHYGVGPVVETDIELADTFNAIIYHFNVNVSKTLADQAKKKGVSIRHFNVIYKLFDNIKEEINSKLPQVDAEEVLGVATVQKPFKITEGKKKVNVAGCCCTKGVLEKSAMYHLVRKNETIYTGKLASMKHLKDEVSSIKVNVECGLKFEDPTVSFEPGDTIVCFKPYKVPQEINWDPGF